MTDKQKNLRISEAAEELNVSSSSVRRWLTNGRLQGWKEGRVVRVDRGSIQRFVGNRPYSQGSREEVFTDYSRPASTRWWARGLRGPTG